MSKKSFKGILIIIGLLLAVFIAEAVLAKNYLHDKAKEVTPAQANNPSTLPKSTNQPAATGATDRKSNTGPGRTITPKPGVKQVYDSTGTLKGTLGSLPLNKGLSQNPKAVKNVYLTFDDGPDKVVTPQILNILDQYHVKATFFVIGTAVERNTDVMKEIVQRGHSVGNHTYTHKYEDIYKSEISFLTSLQLNEALIQKLTGSQVKYYRDPGGKLRNNYAWQEFVSGDGYARSGWNVESYDSRSPRHNANQITSDIVKQVERRHDLWSNMVIIMHSASGHENTVKALPTVIQYLQAKGFAFKTFN